MVRDGCRRHAGLARDYFYTHGGAIQKVVLTKTNTTDIRSATFVDLIYGIVLFLFVGASDIPMSTTWVFVGLLAGREIAMAWNERHRSRREVSRLLLSDAAKITIGLLVSVALAYLCPSCRRSLGIEIETGVKRKAGSLNRRGCGRPPPLQR